MTWEQYCAIIGLVLGFQVEAYTIDQIIANAADSSSQFAFLDEGQNEVMVEYDMRFTLKQWQELLSFNVSYYEHARSKRKAARNLNLRWLENTIPFDIANDFDNAERAQIVNAMNDWSTYTCIKFRKATTNDKYSVRFQDGGGCSSFVGRTRARQPITLAKGCRQKGTIIHEIGHAVGFHHEQTRPDRDRFVRILRENIPPNVYYNFQKYSASVVNTYSVPYDYQSIMHYGSTAFSVNGKMTIETLDKDLQNVIGNRRAHSFLDIKLANLMYDCAKISRIFSYSGAVKGNFEVPIMHMPNECKCCTFSSNVVQRYVEDVNTPIKHCLDAKTRFGVWLPDNKDTCGDVSCPSESFVGKDCRCWCPSTTGVAKDCSTNVDIGDGDREGGGNGGGTGGTVTQAPVEGCTDMNTNCERWASRGECSRNPGYMTVYCQKACNVCDQGQSCADMDRSCDYWQGQGYCTRMYVSYMRTNCPLACGVCSLDEGVYSGSETIRSLFTFIPIVVAIVMQ